MDKGGAPANNNRPGSGQIGYPTGGPRGAGQADTVQGAFNRPYPGHGGGFHGRREGGNRFDHPGRGYGGYPRPQREVSNRFHQPQIGATPMQNPQPSAMGARTCMEPQPRTKAPHHKVVEVLDRNNFKTKLQSKTEMQRMIKWGTVQTKDEQAKMVIEESSGGSHCRSFGLWRRGA
jgi:hypothetical protein